MDLKSLSYFDAAIAVSGDAINRGFQRLFDENQLRDKFKFDVGKKKYGKKLQAQIGLPRLGFIPDQSHFAKITVEISQGKYLAGKMWSEEEQRPEEISCDLRGSSLSFNVDLRKVEYPHSTTASSQTGGRIWEISA